MSYAPRPMGRVSARVNGVIAELTSRSTSARDAAERAERLELSEFAASLRGKAKGYDEALVLLRQLEWGRRLGARRRHRG